MTTTDMANRITVLFPAATFGGVNGGAQVVVRDNADGNGAFIDWWPPALGTQPTLAQLTAVTHTQLDALALSTMQADAIALVNLLNDPDANRVRAVALALVQYLNTQYLGWATGLMSAIAAATSLANLQSRAASLTLPASITRANAIAAITAQITSGAANGVT